MRVLGRAAGLIARPKASWATIAAEGDTRRWLLRRYLPAIAVAPGVLQVLIGLPEGFALRTEGAAPVVPGADGRLDIDQIIHLSTSLAGLLAMLLGLGFCLLAGVLLRDMVLQAALRHGAPADPVAATKLATYGQTGFVLAGLLFSLPVVGGTLWILGLAYGFWLLRRGADALLPAAPGHEVALRWTVTWRAILASAIALAVTMMALMVLMLLALGGSLAWLLTILRSVQPDRGGLSI